MWQGPPSWNNEAILSKLMNFCPPPPLGTLLWKILIEMPLAILRSLVKRSCRRALGKNRLFIVLTTSNFSNLFSCRKAFFSNKRNLHSHGNMEIKIINLISLKKWRQNLKYCNNNKKSNLDTLPKNYIFKLSGNKIKDICNKVKNVHIKSLKISFQNIYCWRFLSFF